MTRKKVNLTYITNYSKRKATFKKRKNGLIKKVHELSVLCRIKASAIIYTPGNPQPEIWPCQKGVISVLSEFKAVPKVERREHMLDIEICTRKMIIKAKEKLEKVKNANKKKEMNLHMSQYFFNVGNIFDNANVIDQNGISHFTTQNLQKTKRKFTTRTAQKVTLVLENEREIMTQGEQASMNHVRESKTNVVAMKNLNRSVEINNDSGNKDKLSKLQDVFLKWLA